MGIEKVVTKCILLGGLKRCFLRDYNDQKCHYQGERVRTYDDKTHQFDHYYKCKKDGV